MALAYRAKAEAGPATTDPMTISLTTTPGDKLLGLCITGATTAARTGGAPTWNSGAQTFTPAGTNQAGSAENNTELWYLINPNIGTYAAIAQNDSAKNIWGCLVAFTAGGAVSLFGTPGQTGVSTQTPSLTINSIPAGGMTVSVVGHGNKDAPTSNQTTLYLAGASSWSRGAIYRASASSENVTHTYTHGASDDTAMVMAAWQDVTSNIKSVRGLLRASISKLNGLAIASVKSRDGLA